MVGTRRRSRPLVGRAFRCAPLRRQRLDDPAILPFADTAAGVPARILAARAISTDSDTRGAEARKNCGFHSVEDFHTAGEEETAWRGFAATTDDV